MPPTGDRQTTLASTGRFRSRDERDQALHAVNGYLKEWRGHPEERDVVLTRQCLGFLLLLDRSVPDLPYEDQSGLASNVANGLPLILSNGVPTAGRLWHPDKVEVFLGWMTTAHERIAVWLDRLQKHTEDEARSFLVNGVTQVEARGLGSDAFLSELKKHYVEHSSGDDGAAYAGFSSLKQLNPYDTYVRNMLGSILLIQNQPLPALQHFLYGFSLAPTDPHLAQNTMRCLSGLKLYPAVLEVGRHYTQLGGNPDDPAIRPWTALARACCAGAGGQSTGCVPADFSEQVPDVLDEVTHPHHPWMPGYLFSVEDVMAKTRVFISYRRSGAVKYAARVEQAFRQAYPTIHVFRDESSLRPGADFTQQLQDEIDEADVFLSLIDSEWSGDGVARISRLLDSKDILRREIARAMHKEVVLIPVLLDGARMPPERDFPEEIVKFSRVHALTLSEATFDRDFRVICDETAKYVEEKRLRLRSLDREMARLSVLEKFEPELATRRWRALFKPWRDTLPHFYGGTSVDGKGVTSGAIAWDGFWECTGTRGDSQVVLRFEAEPGERSLFTGIFAVTRGAPASQEPIRGTCRVIWDVEKDLLLGLALDAIKSGTELNLQIPFDRQIGPDLIGIDSHNVTWVSRKVDPPADRRVGF
jgi:hypothetical protein